MKTTLIPVLLVTAVLGATAWSQTVSSDAAGRLADITSAPAGAKPGPPPVAFPAPTRRAPTVDLGPAPSVSANNPPPVASTVADEEWAGLAQSADVPAIPGLADAHDDAALKQVLSRHADQLVVQADKLKSFAARNPDAPQVAEAKRQEAILLIQAAQAGDTAIAKRKAATVAALRADPAVPEPVRAEIGGLADFTTAAATSGSDGDRRLAFETVALGLVREFPAQSQGYESLLTLAREGDEAKGRELAGELLGFPGTSPGIRKEAIALVARYDLVGRSLAELLGKRERSAFAGALKSGSPLVIYTWATWSPASVDIARLIAGHKAAAGAAFGLNLDRDVAAAQVFAQAQSLPGSLLYDQQGPDGSVATILNATGAPLVYLVDTGGVIRDVRGVDDLEAKLGKLGF